MVVTNSTAPVAGCQLPAFRQALLHSGCALAVPVCNRIRPGRRHVDQRSSHCGSAWRRSKVLAVLAIRPGHRSMVVAEQRERQQQVQ